MNMQAILKQAQKMQKELGKAENELNEKEYTSSIGGGIITVTMKGSFEIIDLSISDEVYENESKEELTNLVVSCINEAMKQVQEEKSKVMNKLTGGIKMPGGF